MSDAKRYKAALVSQYSDVVLAIDHDAALAAKDARIAELERALSLTSGAYRQCVGEVSDTPSEDGVEVPEVVGVRISSDGFGSYIADSAMGVGALYPGDVREPLMTVAQHSRIVAAKDAEIARLKELAHETGTTVSRLLRANNEKRDELNALKAQPARQVGGDEREQFEAWHRSKFATKYMTGDPTRDMHNGKYDDNYGPPEQQVRWECWQARAALAPAAVAVPEQWEAKLARLHPNIEHGKWPAAWKKEAIEQELMEFRRLNRRAIPVELLKRVVLEVVGLEIASGLNAYATDELRALLGKDEGGQ